MTEGQTIPSSQACVWDVRRGSTFVFALPRYPGVPGTGDNSMSRIPNNPAHVHKFLGKKDSRSLSHDCVYASIVLCR